MSECYINKIEYVNLFGGYSIKDEEEGLSRWEILARNANLPWRFELPCTGENGEAFVYDSLEAR
jgi:hypothetical protein